MTLRTTFDFSIWDAPRETLKKGLFGMKLLAASRLITLKDEQGLAMSDLPTSVWRFVLAYRQWIVKTNKSNITPFPKPWFWEVLHILVRGLTNIKRIRINRGHPTIHAAIRFNFNPWASVIFDLFNCTFAMACKNQKNSAKLCRWS